MLNGRNPAPHFALGGMRTKRGRPACAGSRTEFRAKVQSGQRLPAGGQTGSFNYSAAPKNAENVLALRNAPELAAQYAAEWKRLRDEAESLPLDCRKANMLRR